VDAVLAPSQIVRLSIFPLQSVRDISDAGVSAPAPRASAIFLSAPGPVVVVARPIRANGQFGQAVLFCDTVQSHWRHAQAATRVPILLPGHLLS